jgi:hypothetical protein
MVEKRNRKCGHSSLRDLLLNFTAEFVSHLDNGIFAFAKWGYNMGVHVQKEAGNIATAKLSSDSSSDANRVRKSRILRALFLASIFATLLGFWLRNAKFQTDGEYLSQTIYVQFGDEFSPALGAFSGLYELSTSAEFFDDRVEYIAKYPGIFDKSAKFRILQRPTCLDFFICMY